jgi:hypothetical protein
MRNITGSVIEGSDFFDRETELARLWGDLETDNLLMLSPRRIGKTSILRRMHQDAHSHGFDGAIFQDVSACRDEFAFVRQIATALLETDGADRAWGALQNSPIGKFFGRVQKAGGAGFNIEFRAEATADWERIGEGLADSISRLDGRWLLLIDELAVFITNLMEGPDDAARIRQFLYWLRKIRLQYPKLRWLLTGSIGLDTIAARLNISDSINDLGIVAVGPFSKETADRFLKALADSYKLELSPEVRAHVLGRIGWLAPFYLQLAFKLRLEPAPLTTDSAEHAINSLLEPQYQVHFDYWRQRLERELDHADASHATELLNAAARDPQGVTLATLSQTLARAVLDARQRQDRLRYLLDVLASDGYFVQHEGRYRFRFPLLREYWLRHVAPFDLDPGLEPQA